MWAVVSRHCPALLAALWAVVVAALQERCSWEEFPPFRPPPRKARETHTFTYISFTLPYLSLYISLSYAALNPAEILAGAADTMGGGSWEVVPSSFPSAPPPTKS